MTNAELVAKAIVGDWMRLEADERRMDILVKLIEEELVKAFTNGIRYGAGDVLHHLRALKTVDKSD